MATDKQSGVKGTLTARVSERFLTPTRASTFERRTWFSVTVAGVVCIYAGLIAAFLLHDRDNPTQVAQVEETPVEVVVQPPPPAPSAPVPPADKPPEEKPATSAPRAFNDTPADETASDEMTHAPKSDAPAAASTPPPDPAETKPDEPKPETAQVQKPDANTPDTTGKAEEEKPDPKPDATPPKDVLSKDAEALDKIAPEPPKRPAKLAAAKPAPAKVHHAKTALQQLAGASSLPDYAFAKPMHKHPKVSGGTEDDRYLAVVYGMITQDRSAIIAPNGDWHVAVAFEVDGSGNLVGVGIQQSSGYPAVDVAAMQAIQRAAPFPPPPSGATTGLVARLNSGGAAAAGDD